MESVGLHGAEVLTWTRDGRPDRTKRKCGNECKGKQHWNEMEDRQCRVCDKGEENIHHILKECKKTRCDIEEREFLKENRFGNNEKNIERKKNVMMVVLRLYRNCK
ncbi:hypothetical protein K0M31_001833 [Melipona bicolor]|uniref:Uncharacterized protein n=1 Tax=Melipona bicolor TaxID=60889 RepID=A0AA40GGA8_9HYME|nr:hypothetical protein K0M31_001833 [Melipona bicolor]